MRQRKNDFDCVEMMHRGAELVREQTKGMSPEEELAFWQRKTEEMLARKRELSKTRKAS